jgi:tRNA-specific 2-thiouridylase
LYVLEIDGINNRIVVGPKNELRRESFRVQELHCVSPKLLRAVQAGPLPLECAVTVQVRSRHRGVPARLRVLGATTAEVFWNDEWAAVSPGQAAVFYDCENSELLGGGRIAPSEHSYR